MQARVNRAIIDSELKGGDCDGRLASTKIACSDII